MRVVDVLSRDEIADLNRKSNWAGIWSLAFDWGLIALCFELVARWPHVGTVLLALVLIGSRQLGLAVLMHDCGHKALFKSPRLNVFAGRWLCGAPVFADLESYYSKHQVHHTKAGSTEDPDLANYEKYAISRSSFARKIARDLVGWTGVRTLLRVARFGGPRLLWRPLLVNALLIGSCVLLGRPELYLLWIGSWLTTNMLFSRLRQVAEHAVVPDLFDPDPLRHTRTTLASWWERLTVAPNHVNFHLEHHLLPSVPPHRLPELHRLLLARGFYDQADIATGYRDVVGRLTLPASEAASNAG